jgi:serine/threonine protein kinase/tetratricopeptide (TPR) repeat protein
MSKPPDSFDQPFVPRYQVTGFVGEGAAARIYSVVDQRDGSVRAIKALKPETNADPTVVKRFEDEYRILRGLHHPSLPEVHDYGFTEARRRYMVMDLVEGDSLDRYFQRHKEDLWLLLYELCEAISFIHSHDLLHLDLKPANILVKRTKAYGEEKPMVMLMDFGLSYRRKEGEEVSLVGTPEYMAPEIIRGEGRLTRAADYYSMGITLYELLVGKPPFQGEMREVFAGHLNRDIRFREEKTEYSELYPHVLGLVGKEINPRLESFEEFRRAVVGRLGGGIKELDRAYGLSFISSIGMIGKNEAWEQLLVWMRDITNYMSTVHKQRSLPKANTVLGSPLKPSINKNRDEDGSTLNGSGTDKLFQERYQARVKDTSLKCGPPEPARVLTIAGPNGSGKSFVVKCLRNDFPIRDCSIFELNKKGHYEFLVGAAELQPAFHERNKLEGFVRGWERLVTASAKSGVLVVMDGIEDSKAEEREFLDYVRRRIDIAYGEGDETGVYIVITGNHPRLDRISARYTPRQAKARHITLTHPQQLDLKTIVEFFRGHAAGIKDLKRLHDYLSHRQHSFGGIMTGLIEGLLSCTMVFSGGKWRITSNGLSLDHKKSGQKSYLGLLWDELANRDRLVMTWLICHDGPIYVNELTEVSALSSADIKASIESLSNYHLVEASSTTNNIRIGLSNPQVRDLLHDTVNQEQRTQTHVAYAKHYERLCGDMAKNDVTRFLTISHQLCFQYELSGNYDKALKTKLQILSILKRDGRHHELQELCRQGVSLSRRLSNRFWAKRKWHIERYFLKQWMEGQWLENDYEGVVTIMNKYFHKLRRPIPISFAFKYCLSLDILGRIARVPEIINDVKSRITKHSCQPYANILILEALVLERKGRIKASNRVLKRAYKHRRLMTKYAICRMYVCLSNNFELIGEIILFQKTVDKLITAATEGGFQNELHIGLTAKFNMLFEKLRFVEAKRLVNSALTISAKSGLPHRQGVWYFRASGVYYEEGNYRQALNYASKSLRVAENLGQNSMVCELLTRHAMIYQNMGLYGNSRHYLEKAFGVMDKSTRAAVKTVGMLFALDLQLSMKSRDVDKAKTRVDAIMARSENKWRMGYYQFLLGIYFAQSDQLKKAQKAFGRSRVINRGLGVVDDEIRAAIKEAWICIMLGDLSGSRSLIIRVKPRLGETASRNIVAEFWGVKLAYHYFARSSRRLMITCLQNAEKYTNNAYEVPSVLLLDKLLFRVNARLGRLKEAEEHFKNYIRVTKRLLANMRDEESVEEYLESDDECLIRHEYRILIQKQKKESTV